MLSNQDRIIFRWVSNEIILLEINVVTMQKVKQWPMLITLEIISYCCCALFRKRKKKPLIRMQINKMKTSWNGNPLGHFNLIFISTLMNNMHNNRYSAEAKMSFTFVPFNELLESPLNTRSVVSFRVSRIVRLLKPKVIRSKNSEPLSLSVFMPDALLFYGFDVIQKWIPAASRILHGSTSHYNAFSLLTFIISN